MTNYTEEALYIELEEDGLIIYTEDAKIKAVEIAAAGVEKTKIKAQKKAQKKADKKIKAQKKAQKKADKWVENNLYATPWLSLFQLVVIVLSPFIAAASAFFGLAAFTVTVLGLFWLISYFGYVLEEKKKTLSSI